MRRALLVGLAIASSRVLAQTAPPTATPLPPPAAGSGATGSGAPQAPTTPAPEPVPTPPVAVPPVAPTSPTTPAAVPVAPPAPVLPPAAQKPSDEQSRQDALQRCAAHDPACDWLATYSVLEKQSLRRALAARGLEIDEQPWGKQIAHVFVYNEAVFAEPAQGHGFFPFLYREVREIGNVIHYTTRERAIRDELPIAAGDMWNDDKVAEGARILRDPLYSSVVAMLPIKASAPGKVDLLVVTRDVWSLRFNTQYTVQQGDLTNLSISISENNFLGNRDVLALASLMDQGSLAFGPLFIDKNLLGKHLYLSARIDEIITRQSLKSVSLTPDGKRVVYTPTGDPRGWEDGGGFHEEGRDATITLSRPLWSLASKWGASSSFSYSNAISRSYLSTGIRAYNDPSTPEIETIPREFRYKTWSVGANATRQWGSELKQQFAFGYTVSNQHPSLLGNTTSFPVGDLGQRGIARDFIRDVFPHDEIISQPYVEYSFFQPKYQTIRNLSTYELAEDIRLGPSFDVSVAQALSPLGSTHTFTRPAMSGGWTLPLGRDGFISPSAGFSLRIQPTDNHDTIDNTAQVSVRAATPLWAKVRVVIQTVAESRWHDTQNGYYTIGSNSYLRGYPINAFFGQRLFSTIVEARSTPVPWWVFRVGGVAFYEAGGSANSFAVMPIFHDVGLGVRLLIPQTSRDLFRFDVAMPLRSSPGNPAFRPHLLLGFASYF